jgi:hypothetical protein
MFDRRDFLTTALGALTFPQERKRAPIIDGLGEIHAAYDDALLDEIRKEIAEYDQLIAAAYAIVEGRHLT